MLETVLLTSLGVGGATIVGALIGFLFKKPSQRFNDMILSFAAGVMLCASVVGLIIPSLEMTISKKKPVIILITIVGIFLGAICLNLIDRLVPHLHKMTGVDIEAHPHKTEQLNKVLLFVIAIAIHNLPEGIAAGVSFGTENTAHALVVAGGIALQNIPEGMVIIAPMIASGMSKKRTFLIALSTGLIEIVGTLIGYFAASISTVILPFALAFAGGTMLYVISDEMIPETHSHGNERISTYALLVGFATMLCFDFLLG
ncbi:MAG: ZIP family metal transporter [Clostridia bacterium]|nr:ZIP family metal transporter [Clostridia bacterium]